MTRSCQEGVTVHEEALDAPGPDPPSVRNAVRVLLDAIVERGRVPPAGVARSAPWGYVDERVVDVP
jgi:hypothetical protein